MNIAIIGGGLGGLASALALTQAGFTVTVHERSKQLADLGAGITLAPNATRELEATSVTPPHVEYRHYRTGEVILRLMTRDYRAIYGAPYIRLHRWDLQEAMIKRLAEVAPNALRLDSTVERVEPRGSDVELRFADGRSEIADVVVAADGIRSAIREDLFSPAPPVFSGFVGWRGLVDTSVLPRELHESAVAFGHGRHINRYLVRRGKLHGYVRPPGG